VVVALEFVTVARLALQETQQGQRDGHVRDNTLSVYTQSIVCHSRAAARRQASADRNARPIPGRFLTHLRSWVSICLERSPDGPATATSSTPGTSTRSWPGPCTRSASTRCTPAPRAATCSTATASATP